jgi:hypothetical protein
MIHAEPSDWSQAWEDRRDDRIKFRTPAAQDGPTITARCTRRSIQHRWSASLISFFDHDGQQSKAVWAECSSFKGSGRWLDDGPGGVFYGRYTFRSPIEYTMSLRMRLLLPPTSSDVGAPGPILCSCGRTVNADDMPFHCLDCSSSQFFHIHRHNAIRDVTIDLLNSVASSHIHRHNAIRDATINLLNSVASSHTSILSVFPKEPLVLPPTDDTSFTSLRDDAAAHNTSVRTAPRQSVQGFRTSRAFARNSGQARADCGFITTTTTRRYIDITCSNPAASTYSLRGIRDPHGDPLSIPGLSRVLALREVDKRARYRPILGDLVDDPQHLAIFLVEATGRLSDPAMDLVKFIVEDSPSRAILNTFCSQIGGSIARYNAMAAHAWGSELLPLLSHLGVVAG